MKSALEPPDPRAVVALLANDDVRRVFAIVSLNQRAELSTPTARELRAVNRLVAAGMIIDSDGFFEVNTQGLLESLTQYSVPRPEGIDRFVQDGRISNYPASDRDRREVLEWVGQRVLEAGEIVTEGEINERLRPLMNEHVLLRRYLVDYGVVERNPDGTNYSLADPRE